MEDTMDIQTIQRFKQLLVKGKNIEKTIGHKDLTKSLGEICDLITVADAINAEGDVQDRAENTTEVVLDVQVLRMNHELMSLVLSANSSFSEEEYVNALCSKIYQTDEPNWHFITKASINAVKSYCGSASLLGAVDIGADDEVAPSEKKQKLRRQKSQLAQEAKPESVDKVTRADKGAQKVNYIHEQIAHIFKNNKCQPIPFFKLVIDPNSFMRTVENIFQVSFLVREGLVGIDKNESGLPTVRLVDSKNRYKTENNGNNGTQAIASLSFELYQNMIEHYDIKEAMLNTEKRLESESDSDEETITEVSIDDE